jgi:hypothetical protein
MTGPLALTAACLLCGQRVTLLEAPLHFEDHKQAGDVPHQHGPWCDPITGVCDTPASPRA